MTALQPLAEPRRNRAAAAAGVGRAFAEAQRDSGRAVLETTLAKNPERSNSVDFSTIPTKIDRFAAGEMENVNAAIAIAARSMPLRSTNMPYQQLDTRCSGLTMRLLVPISDWAGLRSQVEALQRDGDRPSPDESPPVFSRLSNH